jgi:hypothetical protein
MGAAAVMNYRLTMPVKYWSPALKIGELTNPLRPPRAKGLVYIVAGQPFPDRDVKYLGSAHATEHEDGLERIGNLISAMFGFETYHSGGNKLAPVFSLQQVNEFHVMWALIVGCPILAERELRLYYLAHPVDSPDFRRFGGDEPQLTRVCKGVCIPQQLGWSEPDYSVVSGSPA